MADQDPFAATAIKPTAKKRRTAAPAGDPFAATAVQAPPTVASTAPRYTPPLPSNLPPQEGFLASAAAPFVGAVKGLKSAFYEGPQNPQEAAVEGAFEGAHPSHFAQIPGRAVLAAKRMLVDPQVEQGRQAMTNFSQAAPISMHPTQDQLSHRQLALGHALAAAIPAIGPWAATVAEKEGEQLGTGNYSGAAGTAVGNAALALAPKALGKVKEAVPGAARRLAGSGPGVARDLVRTAAEDNRKIALHNADRLADARQAWQEKQAKAVYDHKAEILRLTQDYKKAVNDARKKAGSGTAADRAKYESDQQAAKVHFDTEVRNATEKFNSARAEAQRSNAANENMLNLRRQAEQSLQQATDEYYAKNAAADVRAKGEENAAWSKLWSKMAGRGVDGGQIVEPLKRIAAISPETAQFLSKLRVPPEDAPPGSPYAQSRASIMQAQGYRAPYESFPKHMRDEFDRIAVGSGFEPEPLDFNPQQGQIIPIEQVHRASSILQGYIRDGKFNGNGPLLGEMKQLAKTLRASVTRAAAEAKATEELNAARNSTIVRQGAFGKRPYSQTTTRTALEQKANPEAAAQRAEEAELARTYRYDPSLVDAYRQVKAARKALDKLPDEDQLRTEMKQVPRVANLPQKRLQEPPPNPRAENLPLPHVLPDVENIPFREPKLTPSRTISADDIQRANEAGVHRRGTGVVSRLIGLSVVWPAFRMLSDLTRGRTISPGGLAAIPAAGVTGIAIEELLAHPAVREFLTRPTRQQIAQIPLELQGDMPNIVETAKARGVQISPLLAAYAGAIQRNQAGQSAQSTQGDQQ